MNTYIETYYVTYLRLSKDLFYKISFLFLTINKVGGICVLMKQFGAHAGLALKIFLSTRAACGKEIF